MSKSMKKVTKYKYIYTLCRYEDNTWVILYTSDCRKFIMDQATILESSGNKIKIRIKRIKWISED